MFILERLREHDPAKFQDVMTDLYRDEQPDPQDYAQNIEEQNQQAIGESVTATLLLSFMENKPDWTGKMGELLRYFEDMTESQGINKRELPGSPQALGRKLHEVAPNLAGLGYDLAFSRSHHPRTITITRRRDR